MSEDEAWEQQEKPGPKSTKSRTVKKIWKTEEVYKLVAQYEKLLPEKSIFTSKKEWWNVIASNLRDVGIMVNGTTCECKWNNILLFYKNKGKNYPPRLNLHKKIGKRIVIKKKYSANRYQKRY